MTALQQAIAMGGSAAFLANESGDLLSLPPRPHQREVGPNDETDSRGLTMLNRLNEALATEPGPVVVDAAQVAHALDLTVRSARRVLQGLVVDGLAWPMPPARTPQAGRPRQLYRLITTKLNGAPS
jgi:hypothetical protein